MKNFILLVSALVFSTAAVFCQNYNRKFVKQVKKALGKDAKYYTFLSYPVDDFGVLTFYHDAPTDNNQICAPFSCIERPKPAIGSDDWLNMYGYVSPASGGTISLDETDRTEISLKTLLPKIFQAIKLSGSFDLAKVVHTTMDIQGVHKRIMEPRVVIKKIDSLPDDDMLKSNLYNKKLVYAYADYVVDKMTVTVSITDTLAIAVEASLVKLGTSTNDTTVVDSKDANVSLSFKKESKGTYTITFNHPVIIARSIKYQPTQGGLSVESDTYLTKGIQDPSLLK